MFRLSSEDIPLLSTNIDHKSTSESPLYTTQKYAEPVLLSNIDLRKTREQSQNSKLYKLKLFVWDSYDKHPLEQSFLRKLDFYLLSSSMLGYFIKTLNQRNINTAYINGMNEYFNMDKNQLNYLNSFWTFGYILGQIPSNLLLHKVSARYYLGSLEIAWCLLTLTMVSINNLNLLYLVRFLVGLTESGFFPAIEFLLGSWYSSAELSKRSTLFAVSASAAGVISGPLQELILKFHSNGDIPPFKWMFIYDAAISFPVAFYTMAVCPNTPSTTSAWYFTNTDKHIGLERRRLQGANVHNQSENYTIKKLKSYFQTWHLWVFPFLFLMYNNSGSASGQPTFTTWLKYDLKLDSKYYNYYPSLASFISIIVSIVISFISDYLKGKYNWLFIVLGFIFVMSGCISLAIWDIPNSLHWISYFLIALNTWGQPQIFSWVNRLLYHDDMKRNFVIVCTNVLAYVTGAIIPIFVWNTEDKPKYHLGFTYTSVLCGFGTVLTLLALQMTLRDQKRN